jgi:hypothetical protein
MFTYHTAKKQLDEMLEAGIITNTEFQTASCLLVWADIQEC